MKCLLSSFSSYAFLSSQLEAAIQLKSTQGGMKFETLKVDTSVRGKTKLLPRVLPFISQSASVLIIITC